MPSRGPSPRALARPLAALLVACGSAGPEPVAPSVPEDAAPPAGDVPAPAGPLSVDPPVVMVGEAATVRWSYADREACTASGAWSGARPATGSEAVSHAEPGAYDYALACTGGAGAAEGSVPLVVTSRPAERVPVPPRTSAVACTTGCLYVDARAGSDGNDGRSPATAFATLQRAADAVVPGSTVLVLDGVYTSDGTVNPLTITTSGRPDAWITFAAAPGHRPVIQIPREGGGATAGIHLAGASYVIVDGFEVIGQNHTITPEEAAANDGSQALLNHNCIYVDGMGWGDLRPEIPHDVVIRNNVVHGCSAAGIEANVADALTIAYNHVYDSAWYTVFGTSGIGLFRLTDAPGRGTTHGYANWVVGNLVHGNRNTLPWRDGNPPGIYDGNGIIVDDSQHTQPAAGPHDAQGVPYTGRTYVANNVVHGNGGRGIHVYASSHVDVVNNTAHDDLHTDSPHIRFGEIDAEASIDVHVLNNVAVNLTGKDVNADDGNVYAYNLWSGASVPFRGAHDAVADPLLEDPAGGAFAPRPGSPALRTGTDALAPTLDFHGNPRPPGAVDRGAIQVSR